MRITLWILAAITILCTTVILVAPFLISTAGVRSKAFAKIEAASGYRLRASGPVWISIFPSIDLVAEDVGVAQPKTGSSVEFATARVLRLGLRLGGLLNGKVQMTKMTLVDPKFTLPLRSSSARAVGGDNEAAPTSGLHNLTLDELHIRNGMIVFPASEGNSGKSITGLTLDATLPHASGPLNFEASGDYDGDRVGAQGSIGSFAHFLNGGPAPVKLAIEAPEFLPRGAIINGTATYKGGIFTLAQFAARDGTRELAGNATFRDDTLTIAEGVLDDTPFAGTAKIDGDALTADFQIVVEDEPVRLMAAINPFAGLRKGAPASITLQIDAPGVLPAKTTLTGTAVKADDTFALTKFSASSGEHRLSGRATYKDGTLWLSDLSGQSGDRTFAGAVTYKDDVVNLDLTLSIEGKPTKLAGHVANVAQLLDGHPAPVRVAIEAPDLLPAKTSVDGSVTFKDSILSLTEFVAISGGYRLTGHGTYQGSTLTLDPVTAEMNGQRVSGAVTANLAGNIPNFVATLVATSVEKSPSRPTQETGEAQVDTTAEKPAVPGDPLGAPGTETEGAGLDEATLDATDHPQAGPSGSDGEATFALPAAGVSAIAPAGVPANSIAAAPSAEAREPSWSGDHLLPLLTVANGTLNLSLNRFVHDDIKIDAATIKATLSGGKLSAEIGNLQGYGGKGSATLVIDASGEVPAERLILSLTNVDARPFLEDLTGSQTIEGKAMIALDLSAQGDSDRAIVSSLNGTANFEFADGVLLGLNVAKMLRSLTVGVLTGWQFKKEAETAFSKLGASFNIANGQAQTDDLRMIGPLVSVGGAGTIALPGQTLKFRVNPLMLASVEGAAGKKSRLGFPVPIGVSGPWDRPFFYPDIAGVLENPVAAYKQLNKLGGGLIAVPAGVLGIDTGEGGLVEKSIAIPQAITKGVVGGIGQALGTKKQDGADATPAVPSDAVEQRGSATSAVEEPSTGAPVAPTADAPVSEAEASREAQRQQPAAETVPKEMPAAEPAPNQMLQNMFGG